ncbi:MAG: pilin [Candidatus Pacebacteria bacterium]|nr:pilin [Candidatus Paceibacterota bacterium]
MEKQFFCSIFLLIFICLAMSATVLADNSVTGVLKCGSCCAQANCASGLRCDEAGTPCDIDKNQNTGQCVDQDINVTTFCPFSSHTSITELVNEITKWIFIFALVIAPLMVLLGGFYMLTAAGDPGRANKGKQIIVWAMVGLAVILFAKAFISIIRFVLK